MNLALFLGALLAAGCVVLVALPYLREPEAGRDALDEPGELEQRRLALAEIGRASCRERVSLNV